jgi:Preprotein translocase subunit SecA (ATPase, RNA helicase)
MRPWPPKPKNSANRLSHGAKLDDLLVEAFAVVREAVLQA